MTKDKSLKIFLLDEILYGRGLFDRLTSNIL